MSSNFETKKQIVGEVVSELSNNTGNAKEVSAAVFNYSQISVNELNSLKDELSKNEAKLRVVKNTLIKISLQRMGISVPGELQGQNAVVTSNGDLISPLKTLLEFIKANEKGSVVMGVLNGKVILADQIEELSKLPSREQLLAQVIGGFNGPIRGFVFALNDTQSKLVRVLNAIKESKAS